MKYTFLQYQYPCSYLSSATGTDGLSADAAYCIPVISYSLHDMCCKLQGERLAALQHVLTGWMEEVMGAMAGYVPLQAIGQRILGQYSQQQFGDFRGSLLGLLTAYNYESCMLTTARSACMPSVMFRCPFGTHHGSDGPG